MNQRGQTQIDFAIGASIFLIGIAFVVFFFPVIFEPFQVQQEPGEAITAERATNTLINDKLQQNPASEERNAVNGNCAIVLFEDEDPDRCETLDSNNIEENVALSDNQDIRATLVSIEDGTQLAETGIDNNEVSTQSKTFTRIVYLEDYNGVTGPYELNVTISL